MEIKGKILDATNQPLYLANITIVTGSQINKFGTVAKENGEFSLSSDIISPDSQFKISYQGRTIKLEEDIIGLEEVVIRPQDKPNNINVAQQPSNIKQHFKKHKLVYAGLGGIVGLLLLLTSIKKLK